DHILEDYRPEELPQVSPRDLASVLAGFWRFGQARGGEEPAVRLIRAKGGRGELKADLLEIVQPDAPFLVDSVMGEIAESGAGVRSYDYPRTPDGGYAAEEPLYEPEGSLGVLRDPARTVLRRGSEPAVLSAALRRRLETAEPVVVAKSNLRSRVHRRVYMDYV